LQVRELAAATLTGLLKGDDGSFATLVREQCTTAAKEAQAFARDSKKKKASAPSVPSRFESVPARHGPVLGLSACVLSSPYDVPKWLPKVLMTLAESVHEPSPIKTTVTKTFGDFKRTHADTWMLHRTEFSEEELDVLADLTSSASYFV
jgi:proteasome activator subunit 4